MNILYISKLEGKPWIGPTYSVPKQIAAQKKYDNVLWYNLCEKGIKEGSEIFQKWRNLDYYIDLASNPMGSISSLPEPFNHPDLIIVEQGYPYARDSIRKEIGKLKIPYIVIPRGELTTSAQKKKRLKKIIGNLIFRYPKFMKQALAIQFLTEQENKETSQRWNRKRIIIPNGTEIPQIVDRKKNDFIRCVFIGRMEPYQKGIDLLIDAVAPIKSELLDAYVKIELYGSDFEHKLDSLKCRVNDEGLNQLITFHDAIYGEEKSRLLMNSDIFLIPSRFEGHPTGLLEALSYGVPCIATTGCNMRSEIEQEDAGWTADNNSESIREAFLNAIQEINTIDYKSEKARKLAMRYDWNHIAALSHSLYSDLLKRKKESE